MKFVESEREKGFHFFFYNGDVYKKQKQQKIHATVPRRQYIVLSGKIKI